MDIVFFNFSFFNFRFRFRIVLSHCFFMGIKSSTVWAVWILRKSSQKRRSKFLRKNRFKLLNSALFARSLNYKKIYTICPQSLMVFQNHMQFQEISQQDYSLQLNELQILDIFSLKQENGVYKYLLLSFERLTFVLQN